MTTPRPTPDPACIESAHVIASAMTTGEWIDMRTLGTSGCPRCADFWGDIRDAQPAYYQGMTAWHVDTNTGHMA